MSVRLRALGILAVAMGSLFTAGCYDRAELEEQAFVILLGFDSPKPGIIEVVSRVAVPSKLASPGGQGGSSGGGDFDQGTPLVVAKGRTIHEAMSLMNTGMERRISLSHLSAIVFSEKVARSGLSPYLRTLTRYREFRRNHYLFVSRGDLEKLMQSERPLFEVSATRYIEDLEKTGASLGYAPSVQMGQYLNELFSPATDPILPILAVNPQNKSDKLSFKPGDINRSGGNPVECVGTAVFQKDRMVGTLNGLETSYLQLLNGTVKQSVLTIPSPIHPDNYLSVGIRLSKPTSHELDLSAHNPRLVVHQYIEAELLANQSRDLYLEKSHRIRLERAIEQAVSAHEEKLLRKILHKKNVAPLTFVEEARTQFPTYSAYEKFPWRETLKNASVAVDAKVIMRRLGSQLNSPSSP